ncbi:MAG: putative oxidoreductase C-terminal domain-containing protein, partial [Flavitalea sp.]
MKKQLSIIPVILFMSAIIGLSCKDAATDTSVKEQKNEYMIRLITLDPGHFHAALLQKYMYTGVDSIVHVYAPEGPELQAHLSLVKQYNTRAESPTSWKEEVHSGPDFLQKMFSEKAGNVVVIAGNNQKKTAYIKQAIDSGFNVLADKPMAINTADFNSLLEAFASAEKNKVLLYDIMTERSEINSILQKEFMHISEVFGDLEKGTVKEPAIVKQSVHHFYKTVSGKPLVRPAWFFDVEQQGEGIVDVTTHVIDLIQWSCFPGVSLDYKKDINMLSAKRWATELTPSQFKQATLNDTYPDYLKKDLKD